MRWGIIGILVAVVIVALCFIPNAAGQQAQEQKQEQVQMPQEFCVALIAFDHGDYSLTLEVQYPPNELPQEVHMGIYAIGGSDTTWATYEILDRSEQ